MKTKKVLSVIIFLATFLTAKAQTYGPCIKKNPLQEELAANTLWIANEMLKNAKHYQSVYYKEVRKVMKLKEKKPIATVPGSKTKFRQGMEIEAQMVKDMATIDSMRGLLNSEQLKKINAVLEEATARRKVTASLLKVLGEL